MARKAIEKKTKVLQYQLPIKVVPEKGGFYALCPIWKDCYAQGETVDEVVQEIIAVASSLIELYEEENLKIPLKLFSKEKVSSKGALFKMPVLIGA